MTTTLDLSRSRDAAPSQARRPNLTSLTRPALAAALTGAGLVPPEKAKMRAEMWPDVRRLLDTVIRLSVAPAKGG